MPPSAIASSVRVSMRRTRSRSLSFPLPVSTHVSSRRSSVCLGNFGASPKPPCRGSKSAVDRSTRRSICSAVIGVFFSGAAATLAIALVISDALFSISGRRSRHASASAFSSVGNPGRPCASVGGKYVPA